MDSESTVKSRLKQFISYLNISEREFCRVVGVGAAYIASIKKSIKADKLEAITKHYPELNPIWLMRGDGDMLLPGVKPKALQGDPVVPLAADLAPSELLVRLHDDAQKEKARLLDIVEKQQATIAQLTENNSRLTRLVEGYKKVSAVVEAGSPALSGAGSP